MSESPMLTAALEYAERGWLVIPLHSPVGAGCSCGKPDCSSPAKHPRTPRGLKDASCERAVIRGWWRRWPDANVGIATGGRSGLLVLDVDGEPGLQSISAWEAEGRHLPDTLLASTGRGSYLYFTWPQGAEIRNSASKIAPGLDVRGAGGYVVAPPARHVSGTTYQWADAALEPAPCPEWLLQLIREPEGAPAPASAPAHGAGIGKGARTPMLSSLSGKLHRDGVPEAGILAAALGLNATFDPPHDPEKIRRMVSDMTSRYQAGAVPNVPGELRLLLGTEIVEQEQPVILADHFPDHTAVGVHGRPGDGKTTGTLLLAADLSRGRTPWTGAPCPARNVLVLSNEDSPSRIRKLFSAAGGDLARLWVENSDDLWQLPEMVRLEEAIAAHGIGCAVIDSLASHSGKADLNSHQDTAQMLVPLRGLAEKYRCAVFVIHHLNKLVTSDHIAKVSGSIGITSSFRHNIHVVPDPESPELRLMVNGKSNLIRPNVPALRFRLFPVAWEGESAVTIDEIYQLTSASDADEKPGRAEAWLKDALADGEWQDAGKLQQQAASGFNISKRTLFRAADRVNVERRRDGFGGRVSWRLPISATINATPTGNGTNGMNGTNGTNDAPSGTNDGIYGNNDVLKNLQNKKSSILPFVPHSVGGGTYGDSEFNWADIAGSLRRGVQ